MSGDDAVDPRGPDEVVEALLSALSEHRWRDAAALFTTAFLEDFKQRRARNHRPRPGVSSTSWSDHFAGVESEEELAALDAIETWARHLEATDFSTRAARMIRGAIPRHPKYADKLERMAASQHGCWDRYRAAGTVHDGPRAYVVLVMDPGGPPGHPGSGPMHFLIVLRTTSAGWRVSSEPDSGQSAGIFAVSFQNDDGEMIQLSL